MYKFWLLWISALVIGPIGTAIILSFLGNYLQRLTVNDFGNTSQIWLGGLGVIIHELSHAIVAIIFGHHITRLRLLRISDLFHEHTTLGDVQHSFNQHNWYQKLGNFLIGIAPVYGCALVTSLLQKILLHKNFFDFTQISFSPQAKFSISKLLQDACFWNSNVAWWLKAIFCVLIVMITSVGYGLSHADWLNSVKGLRTYLIVIILFGILCSLNAAGISKGLTIAINFQIFWLIQGIIFMIITGCVLGFFKLLKYEKEQLNP